MARLLNRRQNYLKINFLDAGQLSLNLAPRGQGAVLGQILHVGAVGLKPAFLPHRVVVLAIPLSEAPLLRDVDLKKKNMGN